MTPDRSCTLRRALAMHEAAARTTRRTVRQAMGDPVLYVASPMYRNVRNAFHDRHFSFRVDHAHRYFGFKLMALNDLFRERTIPVRDNYSWFRGLERSRPGFYRVDDFALCAPDANTLLHEAAHLIAFFEAFDSWPRFWRTRGRKSTLLRVMLGESFANSVEVMSDLGAHREPLRFFRRMSCHANVPVKRRAPLRALTDRIGVERAMRVMTLAFVCSNFLEKDITLEHARRIATLAGVPRSEVRVIRSAGALATTLSIPFRVSTTRLYLNTLGYDRDLQQHLADDPLELLASDPQAVELVFTLAAVAAGRA